MTDLSRPLDPRVIDRHRRLREPPPPPLKRRTVPVAPAPETPTTGGALETGAAQLGPQRLSYTIAEAVRATGLSRTRLYDLIKSRELPSKLIGGRRVIPATPLRKLVGEEPENTP